MRKTHRLSSAVALSATLCALIAAFAAARPMHVGIDFERYLEEADDIAAELEAWRAKYGDSAAKNGWIPATEDRSADEAEEDQRQRFFLTKQSIAKAQELNPGANFSTDTPFSLLTDDEFSTFVTNSYLQSNNSRAVGSRVRFRMLRSQQDSAATTDDSSWFSSVQAMVDAVIAQFSAGTVVPASDASTDGGDIVYVNGGSASGSGGSASTSYSFSHGKPGWWPDWWPTEAPATAEPTAAPVATTATPVATTAAPATTTSAPSVSNTESTTSGSVDWTTSSCVSPIQNQGQCGSCWAFATVAAIESAQCITGGQKSLNKYSEQQLVGCDSQNWGCNGGAPEYAFEYVQSNGLCLEEDYPYTASSGYANGCSSSSCQSSDTGLSGYTYLRDEDELLSALNDRPVVVAVASGNSVWKQYTGGVVSSCDSWQLDHAVVAVGYDSTSIKIRNSWGSDWGEQGYIRLSRSSSGSGTCGVLSDMTSLEM